MRGLGLQALKPKGQQDFQVLEKILERIPSLLNHFKPSNSLRLPLLQLPKHLKSSFHQSSVTEKRLMQIPQFTEKSQQTQLKTSHLMLILPTSRHKIPRRVVSVLRLHSMLTSQSIIQRILPRIKGDSILTKEILMESSLALLKVVTRT